MSGGVQNCCDSGTVLSVGLPLQAAALIESLQRLVRQEDPSDTLGLADPIAEYLKAADRLLAAEACREKP